MTVRALTFVLLGALVLLSGCAPKPLPVDALATASSNDVLKQMVFATRYPDATFGDLDRAQYLDRVRDEFMHREPEWSDATKALIRAEKVEIGMTMPQVVLSIGWPNEYPGLIWDLQLYGDGRGPLASSPEAYAAWARAQEWSYGKAPHNRWVYFSKGKVDRMIDNRVKE